jgi:hypothetical protein
MFRSGVRATLELMRFEQQCEGNQARVVTAGEVASQCMLWLVRHVVVACTASTHEVVVAKHSAQSQRKSALYVSVLRLAICRCLTHCDAARTANLTVQQHRGCHRNPEQSEHNTAGNVAGIVHSPVQARHPDRHHDRDSGRDCQPPP